MLYVVWISEELNTRIVLQIWLLVDLRDYGMSDTMEKCGEGNLTNMVEIPNFPGGTENKSVCISRIFSSAHEILGESSDTRHQPRKTCFHFKKRIVI